MKARRIEPEFKPISLELETKEEVEFLKEVLRMYIFKEHGYADCIRDKGGVSMANQMRNFLVDV